MNLDGVLLIISKTKSALRNMHCPFFQGPFRSGAGGLTAPVLRLRKNSPQKTQFKVDIRLKIWYTFIRL